MATVLLKPITRQTARPVLQGRPLMVTLEPPDMISFRLKGCRQLYRLTLAGCFWQAVKADAADRRRLAILARREWPRRRR